MTFFLVLFLLGVASFTFTSRPVYDRGEKSFPSTGNSKRAVDSDRATLADLAEDGTSYVSGVEHERIYCNIASGCKDLNRTCVHVSQPIRLDDGSRLETNASSDEGYCLSHEAPVQPIRCDPRTGEPVTNVTSSGRLRTTCRCFWPSLFDRKDSLSDCSVVRACGGTGKLVHSATRSPLEEVSPDKSIDIHEFECNVCGNAECTVPGKDPHTGLPSCVPIPVRDRTGGLCLYESLSKSGGTGAVKPADTGKHAVSPLLAVKGAFVSTDFANSFTNPDEAYVPNPCAFDAFRGVSMKNECRLTLTPSGTGYCEPLSETVSTVIFDDDYLPNNGGRYSNACYKFTDSDRHVEAYVAEYFVRPRNTALSSLESPPPPLPVLSVEIDADRLIPEVLDMLNARATTGTRKKMLVTQSAIPEDAESIPVPFDKTTMSRFVKEHNDFVFYLPAKFALFRYWAPVQAVKIHDCDDINGDRVIVGFTINAIEYGEYDILRQRRVVACREPYYDKRLAIVPNIDVNPLGPAYNADPTSAVLRFDKSDFIVRPYWYRSYFNNAQEVKAFVANLPSRPFLRKQPLSNG